MVAALRVVVVEDLPTLMLPVRIALSLVGAGVEGAEPVAMATVETV